MSITKKDLQKFATKHDLKKLEKKIDGQIDFLARQINTNTARLDNMYTKEKLDKKFEKIDNQFKMMADQMDKRFEKVDNQFKMMADQMDKRFEKVTSGNDKIIKMFEKRELEDASQKFITDNLEARVFDLETKILK
ncbi:MAG TPA: hypothetical protein VGA49_03505 [Patescibacteria group bacterium]